MLESARDLIQITVYIKPKITPGVANTLVLVRRLYTYKSIQNKGHTHSYYRSCNNSERGLIVQTDKRILRSYTTEIKHYFDMICRRIDYTQHRAFTNFQEPLYSQIQP